MSTFSSALATAGVSMTELTQDGSPVTLTWNTAVTGPILGDVVIVVVPDVHLASGAGGDIFRGANGTANARLVSLLSGILKIAPQFPDLVVVQLGDLYDVWRAYPGYATHPSSDYRIIEGAYGDAVGLLTEQLNARVCVGNHDASLALFPPKWARDANGASNGQLAYGHLLAASRVLAFHGHQEDTLAQAMASQGGSGLVRLATEVDRLSNPLSLAIQRTVDLATDFFGDGEPSLAAAIADTANAMWPIAPPPTDAQGFQSPRWSARAGRDTLEKLVGALGYAAGLKMVIVGHSHRPGVCGMLINDKLVPLVDVGSWVWGRSQFAIVCEGELKIWEVG